MEAGLSKRVACVLSVLALSGSAMGQDSVAVTPGQSDALSPHAHPRIVRYAVDLVSLTSSWGNALRLGPVMKASADDDPLFSTQILGASAISADDIESVNFASTPFARWTVPGAGVNPAFNSVAPTIAVSSFDRQFGVGSSDFTNITNNVVGAIVGQRSADPARLYVTRIVGASGQLDPLNDNTSTATIGGVDASGNLLARADDFAATGGSKVLGENIVRIALPQRTDTINRLFFLPGTGNRGTQSTATTFLINDGTVTTNTPAVLPNSVSPGSKSIVLDFANKYRVDGSLGVSTHLNAAVSSHRGNPSLTLHNPFGGVATVASLARAVAPGTQVDSLNLFAIDAAGGVVATRAATLPSPVMDGAGFSANGAGNAQFQQYLSQVSFRGGNGQVGVGLDTLTGNTIAAATATDSTLGDFIAVARFSGGPTTWTVAAHVGKSVLNGPSGSSIGSIASAAPVSMSSPAVDLHGNIYFVAAFQPTVGGLSTALIKAVNTASGYRLELLLKSGSTFTGLNSGRDYTISRLTLGDLDSVASGSFFSGNLMQQKFGGAVITDPADPKSFGGAIVNATLVYNNGGTPETYEAVMFVGPALATPPSHCPGDADGDNVVDFDDITSVLANWGASYTPGSSGSGDANNDGAVNFDDITAILSNWNLPCP